MKTATFGRAFNDARENQGFKSQAHLDAFYATIDHADECKECRAGEGHGGVWLEGSASWQPADRRCAEWHRLDAIQSKAGR